MYVKQDVAICGEPDRAARGRMNDLEGGCSGAQEAPGALDVGQLGSGLADAEAQGEFAVQLGVREVKITAVVEAIHEGLVGGVAGAMAEADKIQRSGRG